MILKEKHIRVIAIILILTNVLSGSTILSYYRVPRIWLAGLIGLIFLIRGCNREFIKSKINKIFLLWIVFLAFNVMISYNKGNTLKGLSVFFAIYCMMFINFNESEIELLIKLIRGSCIIYAVTVVMAAFFTEPFYAVAAPFFAQSMAVIRQEIASGAYSGLVGDRALAAYFINVGIGVELSHYFKNKALSKKNYIILALYTIALMMTGKRMLFAIELLLIAITIFLSEAKGKYAKCFLGICAALPIGGILINMIPQTQILLQRIVEYSGDDLLNGRDKFWDYCLVMFERKPLWGYGFDTFNEAFADEVHYMYKGAVWNMYAHNIYYELLGETGLIGFGIYMSLFVYLLYASYKLFKSEKLENKYRGMLFIGIALQIIFIVYGFTGNCMYEHEQLTFYFLAITIYTFVLKKLKTD